MSNDLIYAIDTMVTGIGSLGIGNVKDESYVRIVVTNADGPNEFLVRARILDGGWNNLVTISGSDEVLVNVFTYDELEIICQVYDSSTNNVKLVATSYNQPDNIIPPGGTTGQTLIKSSNNDFDLEWAAASSVGSFTDLTDVPSSYVSHANEIVAVNATEDGLEFINISGGGITSLNGEGGISQSFATGTSGTDFGISSATNTHTFNLPTASATNTGKLSSTDWSAFDDKLDSGAPATDIAYTPTTSGDWDPDPTDVQGALDELGARTFGNTNTLTYYDNDGILDTLPGHSKNTGSGGLNIDLTQNPNNVAGSHTVNNQQHNLDPLQNSPSDSYIINNVNVGIDPNNTGFSIGTNGETVLVSSMYVSHQGESDIGHVNFDRKNSIIGNGTDAIDMGYLNVLTSFNQISANTTVLGQLKGVDIAFNVNVASTLDPTSNIQIFTDSSTISCASTNYTSLSANPNITSIQNNCNYTGLNLAPTIPLFSGNAGFNGISMTPNLGTFTDAGYSGLYINPSITLMNQSALGLNVDMNNVTVYAGVVSSIVFQDLTLTFIEAGDNDNWTLEYTSGGTAGSEVVSVNNNDIVVQIDSGVSTATQIKAALDPIVTGTIAVTISGVGSNAQVTAGPTNFSGGVNPGYKKAAYLGGDVQIDGNTQINGRLQSGKIDGFFSTPLVSGDGNPASLHGFITQPTLGDNITMTNADLIGVNTAMLLVIGDNSTVTTGFVGITALGLPAVVQLGTGTTVDRVGGAVFALSLDAGAAGGTIDQLSLCRSITIPNGVTTVNRQYGYEFDLPFGDPATDSWGVYIKPACNNYMAGSLRIGGTTLTDDKCDTGNTFQNSGKSLFEDDVQINALHTEAYSEIIDTLSTDPTLQVIKTFSNTANVTAQSGYAAVFQTDVAANGFDHTNSFYVASLGELLYQDDEGASATAAAMQASTNYTGGGTLANALGVVSNVVLDNAAGTIDGAIGFLSEIAIDNGIAINEGYNFRVDANAATVAWGFYNGATGSKDQMQELHIVTDTYLDAGIIHATDLHDNAQAQGNATDQQVRSGTYTPTLTNVTNVTASTAYKSQWMRVGNVVTVSGRVDIDPTGTGAMELGISLPVASNFTAEEDCAGTAVATPSNDDPCWIKADAANNRASINAAKTNSTNHSHFYTFTYEVL